MRLEAAIKMGFYPAPVSAIELIAKKLKVDPNAVMLDPCAGEGVAVQYLAHLVGLDESRVVAAELDEGRSITLADRLKRSSIARTTDFLSCYAPHGSASLVYLNPPFTGELGYGSDRCELTFLAKATSVLKPAGILVFIIPENQVAVVRAYIHNHYEDCEYIRFPDDVRKYKEIAIFARLREKYLFGRHPSFSFLSEAADTRIYAVPAGRLFEIRKQAYTDEELEKLLDYRPLLSKMVGNARRHKKLPQPPLELGNGHIALLLAAGYLDGKVEVPGEKPHVVRGTCRKTEVERDKTVSGQDVTTISREQIELIIRTVDSTGEIQEITDA